MRSPGQEPLTTQGVSGRLPSPASAKIPIRSAICAMAAQPRRRPRRGGSKRSIRGDQRNLKVQGASARARRPTRRMSIPDFRIQSGMAYQTSPKGMPEAKDIKTTEEVRQEEKAWTRPLKVPDL